MLKINVFEDPWPENKPEIPLESATIRHLQLIDVFLKLIPYFRKDEQGNIHTEALVWSEWRYINYIRFLDYLGVSAHDCPPPWDVAIIWYCHLLSPVRFHRHLWDHKHRAYGLNHHQFPLTRLVDLYNSGKWTHRATYKKWHRWNAGSMKDDSPKLPCQLWPSPPWETKRRSSLFSMFSNKITTSQEEEEHTVRFYLDRACRTKGKNTWRLSDYVAIRTGSRPVVCVNGYEHRVQEYDCELTPWKTIHHLRAVLDRQVAFWKAAVNARDSDPNFTTDDTMEKAKLDYLRFLKLLSKPPHMKKGAAKPTVDMDKLVTAGVCPNRYSKFVPPTLAIDLLWHTHRLYPASYWIWNFANLGRLIDCEPATRAEVARTMLADTKMEWEIKYRDEVLFPTLHSMDEDNGNGYIPDAAVVPPDHPARTRAMLILGGVNPVKERKRYSKGEYHVYGGVYIPFEGWGFECSGGDGGGGGGDGGGCGGDGGGGGGE